MGGLIFLSIYYGGWNGISNLALLPINYTTQREPNNMWQPFISPSILWHTLDPSLRISWIPLPSFLALTLLTSFNHTNPENTDYFISFGQPFYFSILSFVFVPRNPFLFLLRLIKEKWVHRQKMLEFLQWKFISLQLASSR